MYNIKTSHVRFRRTGVGNFQFLENQIYLTYSILKTLRYGGRN